MHQLELTGAIVPKARPRGKKGQQSYSPEDYRKWKAQAIRQLKRQGAPPRMSGVRLDVLLKGKHSRRGDADNIIGSIMDALVQAQILANDNLSTVSGLSIELEYNGDPPTALITISPA